MAIRTTRSQVTLRAPFRLAEIEEELPAGTYNIDTDEEVVEGNERTVFIRTATVISLVGIGCTRMVTVSANGLEAALLRDQAAYQGQPHR